ncbi:NADPH:quinone oxidoreductase family protein [Ovoidimarina sediminis]|uniref:NADPH:quinone oxidoreductase family protein n=1 Tax=Ovoidimarina sediminis TaxID=3079856 RepID=UPI002907A5CD|nr:NADPH:quinone oxidoreductase family protein [Rhodophyticola sp. MJ-SS7]MDU8945399.1 NADPH:quinone oxidoreductase family protein [Rhodophyticola sp. MJ-SS7]
MKSLRLHQLESAPVLEDVPAPVPAAGEVLVRIRACGLNFADLLMIRGRYQERPNLPVTLGMEVSGEIVALGPGVTALEVDQRVAVYCGQGGLAEFGVFPADRCIPLPERMPFEVAAAMPIAYGTSHLALTRVGRLTAGETLLVLGASGGVGLTAVEIGAQIGARVIGAARGAEKAEVVRAAGAEFVLDPETDDIREAVKAQGGADVVYDAVGGDQFRAAFRAMRPEGRILLIGFASGEVPEIAANHLLVKNVSVHGFYWGGYLNFAPDVLVNSLKELFQLYDEGHLRPHVSQTFPLERAIDGLEFLRSRRATGKVVITT